MLRKLFILLCLAAAMSGCSIQQSIESAEIEREATLCIIENPAVREGFLTTLKSSLSERGISHRVVRSGAIPNACRWTASYNARWSWDLALYMSFAEISVYRDGRLDGKALYDATGGGANMGKFIDAETKIRELVNALLQVKTASAFSRVFG